MSGTGYHVYDLPKQTVAEKITALEWSFAVQMFYHPLMCAIRASIIMFLFRMKDYRRRIRYSLHIVCKSASSGSWSRVLIPIYSLVERRLHYRNYSGEHAAMQSCPVHLAASRNGPVRRRR